MWTVDPLPLLVPVSRSPPFDPKTVSRPSILQVSLNLSVLSVFDLYKSRCSSVDRLDLTINVTSPPQNIPH